MDYAGVVKDVSNLLNVHDAVARAVVDLVLTAAWKDLDDQAKAVSEFDRDMATAIRMMAYRLHYSGRSDWGDHPKKRKPRRA